MIKTYPVCLYEYVIFIYNRIRIFHFLWHLIDLFIGINIFQMPFFSLLFDGIASYLCHFSSWLWGESRGEGFYFDLERDFLLCISFLLHSFCHQNTYTMWGKYLYFSREVVSLLLCLCILFFCPSVRIHFRAKLMTLWLCRWS